MTQFTNPFGENVLDTTETTPTSVTLSSDIKYNESVSMQNTAFNNPNPVQIPIVNSIQPSENGEFNTPFDNNNIPNNTFNPSTNNFNNNFNNNSNNNSNKQNNYFVNMTSFFNQKLLTNTQLLNNEVGFLHFTYNTNFNSLRLNFQNLDMNAFKKNQLKMNLSSEHTLNTCYIYSETAIEILYLRRKIKETPNIIQCFDRVFTDSWSPASLQIAWNEECVFLNVVGVNKTTLFTLFGSQIILFENILSFLINGQSWILSGISQMQGKNNG